MRKALGFFKLGLFAAVIDARAACDFLFENRVNDQASQA